MVMKNLLIAFPEKTDKERTRIAKDFYRNFTDTFIETIKTFIDQQKRIQRRFSCKEQRDIERSVCKRAKC